jgi:HAD superfamily hydrolase (TIGR01509 family)
MSSPVADSTVEGPLSAASLPAAGGSLPGPHWLNAAGRDTPRCSDAPLLHLQGQALAAFGQLEALVFDMGDCLYDATVWRRWLWKLLGRLGHRVGYRELFRAWDHEFLVAVHQGRRGYGEAFTAFLVSRGLSRGQIDEVERASQARRRSLESETRPFPGVPATLRALRERGLRLAVLSDSETPSAGLRARLDGFGLAGLFEVIVSSVELQRTKPDPDCYAAALKGLSVAPEQAAFVGHDADELAGARNVGMRSLAYNFEGAVPADLYLGRFEELIDVVAATARGARRS